MPRPRPKPKQHHDPIVIVEIEQEPEEMVERGGKKGGQRIIRRGEDNCLAPVPIIEYSPINSVCGSPNPSGQIESPLVSASGVKPKDKASRLAQATPDLLAKDRHRRESLPPSDVARGLEAGDWSCEEEKALEKILDMRRTLVIHWDVVALDLWKATGIHRSEIECEERHLEFVARAYESSVRKKIVTPPDASAICEEFKAHDPTRRFKMTKLLKERTFKDRPASLISAEACWPKARRYSFINDTLSTDFGNENETKKSALSFLKEVLPERKSIDGGRRSFKLDDDRYMQKLKGQAAGQSKSGNGRSRGGPTSGSRGGGTKRRLQNATLNNLVSGLAAQTDSENTKCLTGIGLNEELLALSNKEDEYQLLLDEIQNQNDNTIID